MKYVLVSTLANNMFCRIFSTREAAEKHALSWLVAKGLIPQGGELIDFQKRLVVSEWFRIMEGEDEDQTLVVLKDAAEIIIKTAKITPGMAAVIGALMLEIRELEQAKEDQK